MCYTQPRGTVRKQPCQKEMAWHPTGNVKMSWISIFFYFCAFTFISWSVLELFVISQNSKSVDCTDHFLSRIQLLEIVDFRMPGCIWFALCVLGGGGSWFLILKWAVPLRSIICCLQQLNSSRGVILNSSMCSDIRGSMSNVMTIDPTIFLK